jgi:hypothetical protein
MTKRTAVRCKEGRRYAPSGSYIIPTLLTNAFIRQVKIEMSSRTPPPMSNRKRRKSSSATTPNQKSRNTSDAVPPDDFSLRYLQKGASCRWFQEAEDLLKLSPHVDGCGGLPNEEHARFLDFCPSYMGAVACVIAALVSNQANLNKDGKDEGVIIPKSVLWEMPGSHKVYHCTASRHSPNFRRLTFREFLVLLADTLRLRLQKKAELARSVVSELQAHLDNDWINFDDLKEHPDLFRSLTERDIRYVVAALGYRINKMLHARPAGLRETRKVPVVPTMYRPLFKEPATCELLADCFHYAEIMKELWPWWPRVGSSRLEWCEEALRDRRLSSQLVDIREAV